MTTKKPTFHEFSTLAALLSDDELEAYVRERIADSLKDMKPVGYVDYRVVEMISTRPDMTISALTHGVDAVLDCDKHMMKPIYTLTSEPSRSATSLSLEPMAALADAMTSLADAMTSLANMMRNKK